MGVDVSLGLSAVTEVLQKEWDPNVATVFGDYTTLFGGQVSIDTRPITDDGLVFQYRTAASDNARGIGVPTGTTTLGSPHSQRSYSSVMYKPAHMSAIDCPVRYEWPTRTFVHRSDAAELNDIAATMTLDGVRDMARQADLLQIADCRGIIADVAAVVYGSDDTTNSRYLFDLYLGAKTIPEAFKQTGVFLHACAVPSGGEAIATIRNAWAPIVTIGLLESDISQLGGYFKIACAMPYDTDSIYTGKAKTDLYDGSTKQLDLIVATDVLTPWGGNTADTSTLPTRGANYGLAGLLHQLTNYDIEQVAIGVTTALTTAQGTTIDRANAAFSFLVPYTYAMSAAAVDISKFGRIIANLKMRRNARDEWAPAILMADETRLGIAESLGMSAFRISNSPGDIATRYAQYGVSGVVYHDPACGPVLLGTLPHLPLNTVLFTAGPRRMFTTLMPKPPEWVPNGASGDPWSQVRSVSGSTSSRTLMWEANRLVAMQFHPNAPWSDFAAMTGTKPR